MDNKLLAIQKYLKNNNIKVEIEHNKAVGSYLHFKPSKQNKSVFIGINQNEATIGNSVSNVKYCKGINLKDPDSLENIKNFIRECASNFYCTNCKYKSKFNSF